VDSYFANISFIKPLMEKGIAIIFRLRKDAVGWDDTPEYSGRGRPRKRGGLSSHDHNRNIPEGATLLHCFLHLEIDVAA